MKRKDDLDQPRQAHSNTYSFYTTASKKSNRQTSIQKNISTRILSTAIQSGQLLKRKQRHLVVVEFEPILIFFRCVIQFWSGWRRRWRIAVYVHETRLGLWVFCGLRRVKDALLDETHVMSCVRCGAFVGDDSCRAQSVAARKNLKRKGARTNQLVKPTLTCSNVSLDTGINQRLELGLF